MKKLSFDDIKSMNNVSLEQGQMNKVFGGKAAAGCTLDTATITPSGGSNDGDDSWSGECAAAVAPASYAVA